MGGPLKSSLDRNKVFTQENVAGKAQAKHRGPSLVAQRLASRIKAFDRIKDQQGMKKPGSQRRHKQ